VLLITIYVSRLLFSPIEANQFAETAFAASTYTSNLWCISKARDYFALAVQSNPLLHTWSLAVEEQFYFVWPLLVMLCMKGRCPRRRLGAIIATVSLTSCILCVWLTSIRPAWAFYGTPMRAWEFGIGALGALLPAEQLAGSFRKWSGWVGIAAIVIASVALSEETAFPGTAALIPAIAATAVLVGGAEPVRQRRRATQAPATSMDRQTLIFLVPMALAPPGVCARGMARNIRHPSLTHCRWSTRYCSIDVFDGRESGPGQQVPCTSAISLAGRGCCAYDHKRVSGDDDLP
jgi:peptidoglycan/LPS O-acetylase OafA/YrhL